MCFLPTFLSPCLRVDHCSDHHHHHDENDAQKMAARRSFLSFFRAHSLPFSLCLSVGLSPWVLERCLLTHNDCITWQCRVVAEDITAFALLVQTNTTMYVGTTDRQTVMDLHSTATTLLYRGCGLWRVSVRTRGYRTDIFHVHSG